MMTPKLRLVTRPTFFYHLKRCSDHGNRPLLLEWHLARALLPLTSAIFRRDPDGTQAYLCSQATFSLPRVRPARGKVER
jgi:hypothetical protein